MTTVEQVNQTLLNLLCGAPTLTKEPTESDKKTGESSQTGEQLTQIGPFQDQLQNDIWWVFASQMMENYETLADIDMLEPNQANSNEAMWNVRLKPFWIDSEHKEMDGLWKRG
eukprot:1675360-Rhodomonas_salina.1